MAKVKNKNSNYVMNCALRVNEQTHVMVGFALKNKNIGFDWDTATYTQRVSTVLDGFAQSKHVAAMFQADKDENGYINALDYNKIVVFNSNGITDFHSAVLYETECLAKAGIVLTGKTNAELENIAIEAHSTLNNADMWEKFFN